MASLEDIEFEDFQFEEQPMCLDFHSQQDVLAIGEITGHLNIANGHTPLYRLKFMKESCRDIKFDNQGQFAYTVSSDKSLSAVDLNTGTVVARDESAHPTSINVLKRMDPFNLVTGDDDGLIKVWDVRQRGCVAQFNENTDFISDMIVSPDGRQLLVTSGDGTLVVLNTTKGTLEAASDNMDDELLSIAIIKNGTRVVVGTQDGVLAIFHWDWWGDLRDRIPGHPASVDTMVKLDEDTVLTGASDGLIRIVQLYPTKILGIVGEHEDFPVERIVLDRTRRVLGSVSHDNTVKLWDIGYLYDEGGDDDEGEEEAAAAAPTADMMEGFRAALSGAAAARRDAMAAGPADNDSDDGGARKGKGKGKKKGAQRSNGFYEDM